MDATSGFRARLREALERRGMSQTELARQLGVRVATVNEWLNRETMPGGAIMLHLPRVLAVDGHWLLTGEGDGPRSEREVGPDQRHRASALLNEALRVLNSREDRISPARPGEFGRIHDRGSGERLSLEPSERRLGSWSAEESGRRPRE